MRLQAIDVGPQLAQSGYADLRRRKPIIGLEKTGQFLRSKK